MPPASNEKAVWEVADLARSRQRREVAARGRRGCEPCGHGAVAKLPSQAVPGAKQVPLRVPFGRGPKDKSFELERRDKPSGKAARATTSGRGRRR